jgi:hypothetical protein
VETAVTRKGKKAKPTEFGDLSTNGEAKQPDHCRVRHSRRPSGLIARPWSRRSTAISTFVAEPLLDDGPDHGFSSAANEREAPHQSGACCGVATSGMALALMSINNGSDEDGAGKSAPKDALASCPRDGLNRCRYQNLDGMHRWLALGVIADNCWSASRDLPAAGRPQRGIGETKRSVTGADRRVQRRTALARTRVRSIADSFVERETGTMMAQSIVVSTAAPSVRWRQEGATCLTSWT